MVHVPLSEVEAVAVLVPLWEVAAEAVEDHEVQVEAMAVVAVPEADVADDMNSTRGCVTFSDTASCLSTTLKINENVLSKIFISL